VWTICTGSRRHVERVPRVVGARDGLPLLQDGRKLEVANVIWSSGFDPAFDWIRLPIFGADGQVRHQSALVERQPGLYFVGLSFLCAMSSSMIHGLGRAAERIVAAITARVTATASRGTSFDAASAIGADR